MNPPSPIKRITVRLLGLLCVIAFTVLLLDVMWGVVTRYLIGDQARWTEELARFLLIWLAFLGAALAYADQQHLGVDLIVGRMDPGARQWSMILTHLVVLLFAAGVMGYGGVQLFFERLSSGQTMPALGIAKAWQYLSVPVSGLLIGGFAVGHLINTYRRGPVDESENSEVLP